MDGRPLDLEEATVAAVVNGFAALVPTKMIGYKGKGRISFNNRMYVNVWHILRIKNLKVD